MLGLRTYQFPDEKSMGGAEMGWIAYNLANHEGFKLAGQPTAWMAPLYPYTLALIFIHFGIYSSASTIATLILQSVASSLTIVPLYLIGKHSQRPRVGAIAGILWALYPGAIYCAVGLVWSSSFTALGLTTMVLLFQRLCDERAPFLRACLCGLAAGFTALSDPVVLTVLPFAALWVLWRCQPDRRRILLQLGVMAIALTAVLTPWTIRNYVVFRQFVLVKGTLGVNLWQGNHAPDINQPTAGLDLWLKIPRVYPEKEVAYLSSLDEIERDKALQDRAIGFIIDHPLTFSQYVLDRVYLFWRNTAVHRGTLLDRFLLGLVPLTCCGIVLSLPRWRETTLLLLVLMFFPVIYYMSHADLYRFRFPIEGLMLVFVANGIHCSLRLAKMVSVTLATKRNRVGK
jgi:hypothetical protein